MDNASTPADTFICRLEKEIEQSDKQGGTFALLFLTVRRSLPESERRKLFSWGQMVLRNHAPAGGAVVADREVGTCAVLAPGMLPEAAAAAAAYFGEQLNKLPVAGVAPGRGWDWACTSYPRDAVDVEALRQRFGAGSINQSDAE